MSVDSVTLSDAASARRVTDACAGDGQPAQVARVPRPLRFVLVGVVGLLVDLAVFTATARLGLHPLLARLVSLSIATVVTWRLNRFFTFARSGRDQGEEAMRYATVVIAAQATSYAVFTVLVLSAAARLPQIAVLVGAAAGALISYNGHRLFAFAPGGQSPSAVRP
jgi:putative flippase GtrA